MKLSRDRESFTAEWVRTGDTQLWVKCVEPNGAMNADSLAFALRRRGVHWLDVEYVEAMREQGEAEGQGSNSCCSCVAVQVKSI